MGRRDPEPPPGARYRDDGVAKEFTASTRRLGVACLMAFLCFLSLVLAATIAWATGDQILRGLSMRPPVAGKSPSLGLALLLVAANLPCLLMGAGLAFCAAMAVGGSVRVRLVHGMLEVSRGVGGLRRTRRVQGAEIVSLGESVRIAASEGGSVTIREITLARRGGRALRFGGDLGFGQRAWMRAALAQALEIPDTTEHEGDDADGVGD